MYAAPTEFHEQYVAPTYVPTVASYEVGRSSKFKQLNFCALYCAVAIFALLIAAATVCWYSTDQTRTGVDVPAASVVTTYTVSYTRQCYDLQGVNTDTQPQGGSVASTYKEYNSSSSLWSVFKLSQAFVLIGLLVAGILSFFLVLCFADALRNKLLFLLGMNVLRVILFIVALLIVISTIIAFLGFLGITTAFSDDNPGCTFGWCRRFSDDIKTDAGTGSVVITGTTRNLAFTDSSSWGANAGWYIDLACIPLSIFLAILVVLNKFPIPVDSVGSGEAL